MGTLLTRSRFSIAAGGMLALTIAASIGAGAAQEAAPAAPKAAAPKAKATAAATKPSAASDAAVKGGQAIVVLVNDEPVTAYEIDQRARFMALSANIGDKVKSNFQRLVTDKNTEVRLKAIFEETIQANQGKSREQIIAIFEERKKQFAMGLQKQAMESARSSVLPNIRKEAQEELIEEKLKLQEAKKVGAETGDEEANKILKDIAAKNKQTPEQFAQNLKTMGADIATMRSRFVANLAWRGVIQRRFGGQINIAQRDVDKLAAAAPGGEEDTTELQIQKITLPLPATIEQAAIAKRLADADALRRKFGGCKSTAALAKTDPNGAAFEDSKYIRPSTIGEPTRSLLLSARDGDMLPPQTAAAGIEMYVVCGRRAIKVDEQKRTKAHEELQAAEYERLAKRHLRDLRQDAHIEFR